MNDVGVIFSWGNLVNNFFKPHISYIILDNRHLLRQRYTPLPQDKELLAKQGCVMERKNSRKSGLARLYFVNEHRILLCKRNISRTSWVQDTKGD